MKVREARRGLTEYEFTQASLSAIDKYDQIIEPMDSKKEGERHLGVFYWLWISGRGDFEVSQIVDVTKLMATEKGKEAFLNTDSSKTDLWEISPEIFSFTNEPMYGYYNSSDPWVIVRHVEQLMLCGVDYIFLDTSNHLIYEYNYMSEDGTVIKSQCYTLLDTLLDLYNKGWNVPKVVFLTNQRSGERVSLIRKHYYEHENEKYANLWYYTDGKKPMIIGVSKNNNGASDKKPGDVDYLAISENDLNYFDVKEVQWPNVIEKENGFPWVSTYAKNYYHTESKAMSVSVAQHGMTIFSRMPESSDRGYNYKTKEHYANVYENEIKPFAFDVHSEWKYNDKPWQLGPNFENQWQNVFDLEAEGKEVKWVNVTGWNEWVGQKFMIFGQGDMIDQFYGRYTRDIEADKYLYQDTTLLQFARNARKYKFKPCETNYKWKTASPKTVEDFKCADAVYVDQVGDAISRNFYGFVTRKGEDTYYTDNTNRNDIVKVSVIHDDNNIYFCIETKDSITQRQAGDEKWMNILIRSGSPTNSQSFGGYNYLINRFGDGETASIEKTNGGWNWREVGQKAKYTVIGNKMMVTVALSAVGLSKDNFRFAFKVSDNVCKPNWFKDENDAEHDIIHYYITGDSAPMGRFSYTYGY